jgi:hypothetical protein
MELRELKIEISEELLESLKKASEEQHLSQEKLASQLLEKALSPKAEAGAKNSMPGVALLKDNFVPDSAVFSTPSAASPTAGAPTLNESDRFGLNNPATAIQSPEKLQRRRKIEERMREISLLIETAENEDKKDEYLQLYAQLAAELEACF